MSGIYNKNPEFSELKGGSSDSPSRGWRFVDEETEAPGLFPIQAESICQ